ncbi:hypothetical protein EXW96_01160 [Paenibacillus sp. JMULE4]|uniref:hypothetical protein n=1 Tax=Paenibacillus sp. JMULE4 TaxID=2518342 RepID=UPI001575C555|nr:hypothetical protein [Paenibacillus sp. JMULE4]NTZ16241.1 hypothetical protein [Paenibacillus sp. JMULE4]
MYNMWNPLFYLIFLSLGLDNFQSNGLFSFYTTNDHRNEPHRGKLAKPRTYRQKAPNAYLEVAKQRRIGFGKLRKAIGRQLKFIARDIRIVEQLAHITPLTALNKRQYKNLLVVHELYRQQQEMYTNRTHQVDDRIVSIHQPHVRPRRKTQVWSRKNPGTPFLFLYFRYLLQVVFGRAFLAG